MVAATAIRKPPDPGAMLSPPGPDDHTIAPTPPRGPRVWIPAAPHARPFWTGPAERTGRGFTRMHADSREIRSASIRVDPRPVLLIFSEETSLPAPVRASLSRR